MCLSDLFNPSSKSFCIQRKVCHSFPSSSSTPFQALLLSCRLMQSTAPCDWICLQLNRCLCTFTNRKEIYIFHQASAVFNFLFHQLNTNAVTQVTVRDLDIIFNAQTSHVTWTFHVTWSCLDLNFHILKKLNIWHIQCSNQY